MLSLFCFFEDSGTEEKYKWIKKLECFHAQHILFAMSDKRKYIKNPYAEKKRTAWNKPTKPITLI